MKSIFGKGRTIFDAIKQAWKIAGEPENFTVKIIKSGRNRLFGFFSDSSVVSLSYKQVKKAKVLSVPKETKKSLKQAKKPLLKKSVIDSSKRGVARAKKDKKTSHRKQKIETWSLETSNEISDYFKQTLSLMGISSDFDVNINKKILNISFNHNILKSKDEEKIFFISLSYLFMQMLKKKHRKKFDGFHIIISSPLTTNNANKQN